MKKNNKSRYIPVISMESIIGVETTPTAAFKSTVTGFIADVLDKLPGKFTPADFAEAYPDSLFNGCIVGLYEGCVSLMIKDCDTKTVAILDLNSEIDGEYELCNDCKVQYFNTEIEASTEPEAAKENMYAIISTEGYEPSSDFIASAGQVVSYMKDNYGNGFSQDEFNTDIAQALLDDFGVSARIDTSDEPVLKIQNDNDAATISLGGDADDYIVNDVTEYWQPGTEAYEVGTVITMRDNAGQDIVSGEVQECGTFGDLKDKIESEDAVGFGNMTAADIADDTQVVKIADNWYYVNDEVSVEYCANESIDTVQQTEGNQPEPIDIDENYMQNTDNLDDADNVVEVLDDEDETIVNAKNGVATQMYQVVEDDNATLVEDETPADKPKPEEPADELTADAALAEEAQRVFAMPNSKFAGNYAIEHMPVTFKHIWQGLSDAAKATFAAQAKQACIATEAENLKFWHDTNFIAIERACLINKGEVQAALESMVQPEDPRVTFMKHCIKA